MANDIAKASHLSALIVAKDRDTANSVGGRLLKMTAAAALNLNDLVYFDSAGKVNKSATAATMGVAFAGVVVGGQDFDSDGSSIYAAPVLATPVAACSADGEWVLVQVDGIAYVRADSAVAAGARAIGGTTAGNIAAGITAGIMVGTVVSAEAAAGAAVVKMLIDHR